MVVRDTRALQNGSSQAGIAGSPQKFIYLKKTQNLPENLDIVESAAVLVCPSQEERRHSQEN